MTSDVSVVIPFFNGSKFIEKALESISLQTVPPKETIIVNDGSNEQESRFLAELQRNHDFKLLTSKNSGQSAARNLGVSNSRGSLICFLDQDDYFLPKHIELLLEEHTNENFEISFSYGDAWRQTESGIVVAHSITSKTNSPPHLNLSTLVGRDMFILPSASMISKSSFQKIGGFDESLQGYEDDDLFLRFFLAGEKSNYISQPVTVWTINLNSTSYSRAMGTSRFIYYQKLRKLFEDDEIFGVNVFGEYLVPRFLIHFVADVFTAGIKNTDAFIECKQRLQIFHNDIKRSKSTNLNRRFLILIVTSILTRSNKFTIKCLVAGLRIFGDLLRIFGIKGVTRFLARHR